MKISIPVADPYDIYLGAGILNTLNWAEITKGYAKPVSYTHLTLPTIA